MRRTLLRRREFLHALADALRHAAHFASRPPDLPCHSALRPQAFLTLMKMCIKNSRSEEIRAERIRYSILVRLVPHPIGGGHGDSGGDVPTGAERERGSARRGRLH